MVEEEFKDVNTRFSIRGMFGQAMVLAMAGRTEEASAVAGRMRPRLPGDPFPERLYVQWDAFSRWQGGDYAGSAAALENALRSAQPTDDETRFDRVDLALMLLQAGQRGRAAELLNPLASAGDAELSPVASLFLNKTSPKELLRDEGYRSRTRSLYGVEYSLLRGRLDEARSVYEFHQAIDAFLTPLLCRVHVQAERAGIDLDP